ncbi:hypothetical protein AB0H73_14915 [Streptomyces olivoreticuli]
MTTSPAALTVSEGDACPSGLCDQTDDCDACGGTGEDLTGNDDCDECGGKGEVTPGHCCACGGSPYCTCCPSCSATYIGACECPVEVTLADGTTKTLPPARDEDGWDPAGDVGHAPEGYYDEPAAVADPKAPEESHSDEPPFPDGPPAPTADLADWPPF